MASVWLVLVLWIYINAWIKVTQAFCAAKVHTPASEVLAGSPVSVSCSIEDDCLLTRGTDFRVAWKINNDFAPSNLSYQENTRTYGLRVPSLTHTADIVCLMCVAEENCQIVDGVTVKVGYLPPVPRNLSCVLNVTQSFILLCQWDPGEKTPSLPTKYTLHALSYNSEKAQYEIPPGKNFYLIPRESYSEYFKLEVYVTAVNVLGNATSAPLELIPMETAKFNAPEIKRIEADKPGCLQYSWSLSQSQAWVQSTLSVELRLTTLNNQLNKELVSTFREQQGYKIKTCGLLHGTNYSSTMRVKYRQWSEWSEWSDPKTATTLRRAPAGSLDTWLKVNNQLAHLYWKPSKHFRANGWDLSYTVESKESKTALCVTQESHCSFNLNKWIKKVYLRATNAMGSSNQTQVRVYRKTGLDSVSNVSVRPQSQTSVLVAWESPESSGVTGYTLEWRSLSETLTLSFILMDKNSSSTLLTGLRPYKPYEISVFPKYADGVGRPLTVMAYSSERAPSKAPKLEVEEIHHSQVKLRWDEVPFEQRNGIIQGYTIYFWGDSNDTQVINTEKTNVVVGNLQPLTKYHALVSVLTMAGSLNGSVENLTTGRIDGFDMVLFVIPACIGLSLLIIIVVFTCLGKHERVKMCLWPIIPDPANSSIKRWTTTDSLQGMPPFKEDKDPVLVFLSRFSLLDLTEKEPFEGEYVKESQWSHDVDRRDGSHSSFQARSYDSEQDRDSVPYATVVFGGSYQSHSTALPPYVRSESTQPLLGADEPGSPPPYENVPLGKRVSKAKHFIAFPQDPTGSEENEEIWEEFPMLRSLEIRDPDHN
ncbi:hypothetical protein R3I94_010471 [Phoxinus phoxinus]